jgi:preprotein translocase subunit SecD
VSFVAFVVLYVPVWGAGHLVTISAISIVFAVLCVRYRRLGPVVVMHFLSDVVLLIVLPALGWT